MSDLIKTMETFWLPREAKVYHALGEIKIIVRQEFTCLNASMDGGGMNFDGPFPDGWRVTARPTAKLKDDRQEISFFQSGHFTCLIPKVLKSIDEVYRE